MSWDQSTIIADFSQTFPKKGQPLIASTYHVTQNQSFIKTWYVAKGMFENSY